MGQDLSLCQSVFFNRCFIKLQCTSFTFFVENVFFLFLTEATRDVYRRALNKEALPYSMTKLFSGSFENNFIKVAMRRNSYFHVVLRRNSYLKVGLRRKTTVSGKFERKTNF